MLKIKMGGVPYSITRVKRFIDVDHDEQPSQLWGQISYQHHSIRFKQTCRERETHTVIHEILHGIIEHGCIRELLDENGNHSETAINQLAMGLAEVLKSLHIELPLDKA